MSRETYPFFLGNEPQAPNHDLDVANKATGETAARVALADAATVDRAIAMAVDAAEPMRRLRPYQRQQILNEVVAGIESRAEELARILAIEAGKPIRDARGEVTRGVDTFRIAAEEAVRLYGEHQPLEISPRARGYQAVWKRVPIGPCSFIAPFNFPLNLVAHKVAPALACGCPFVLKPASRTPLSAIVLGEILSGTDLPGGAFSILPCPRAGADLFTTDDRLKLLSFTGSPEVGWDLKARAGRKKVVLELGGNAACVVDNDADLEFTVERLVTGAFYQSGQSCISVQRILGHQAVYDELRDRLVERTHGLPMGDPLDESTFIGPMISEKEAKRVEEWVDEALARGAKLLCGGKRDGAFYEATLLEDVDPSLPVSAQEVFGPVALLHRFSEFDDALATVNDSAFGLQAGIFTNRLDRALRAWDELEVGGVVIGDVPSMRVDSMPYGGVKDSGIGREGVRFAIEDMTEIRLLVLRSR